MNAELILTQPGIYVLGCVVAGLVVAALLYWGNKEVAQPYRALLAMLRGLAVGLLAFLLLGPLLRRVDTRTQRPVLVIAKDQSESAYDQIAALQPQLDELRSTLEAQYDVEVLAFGEQVRAAGDTVRDASSDLSSVLKFVSETYPPEQLGGLVLLSDGIYNQGNDPIYAAQRMVAPVYTVAVGDTAISRDIAIRDVLYNRIGYLGDRLQIQADVQATNASGGRTTVTLSSVDAQGGRVLERRTININSADDFQTVDFEVELAKAGVNRYRVSATTLADERNTANNSRSLYVDVLDARQQILLIAATPHPDVSAIRQALATNKNYELDFTLAQNMQADLAEVDLVIFHNLPSAGQAIDPWLKKLDERGIGRLFINGPGAELTALSKSQRLLSVTAKAGSGNAVTPQLNGGFSLFSLGEDWQQVMSTYPPVQAPFAEYGQLSAGDVLLTQRIGRVDTDFPLLVLGETSGHKTGILFAQDIWRWRLAEYQQAGNHDVFDGLLLATAQYLALREDKRPFRVTSAQRVYTTSDDVRLQAELYNASYELVNTPDVAVDISDAEGTNYPFVMDKVGQSYRLRAGRLPAGTYTYRARTSFGGEDYSASGGFTVRAVELETLETTADWDLLRRLSAQQGGISVEGQELSSLTQRILDSDRAKPVLYQSVRTRPLIDWPWLLAIVLSLLAVEWFVRRRLGTY